jgi:hypothetical protein
VGDLRIGGLCGLRHRGAARKAKAALAAINRMNMSDAPVAPVASPRRLPVVGAQELDAAFAPRFPEIYAP